jgi:hypothetical protein
MAKSSGYDVNLQSKCSKKSVLMMKKYELNVATVTMQIYIANVASSKAGGPKVAKPAAQVARPAATKLKGRRSQVAKPAAASSKAGGPK